MKPIRLATIGIIAAGAMFGAVAASATPLPSLGTPAGSTASDVVKVGYYCWWSYGVYHCGYRHYHHRYYHRRYYYRY
jgi:hypothetical protein